jgi:3D (Asp-Asp-Asp) domain-containing protein
VTRPRVASSTRQMPTTSSAPSSAERRRQGTRAGRRRASSPLALVAWAAVAGLVTYGQLQRGATVDDEASADDAPAPTLAVPFATPFTAALAVPFPELAPSLAGRPVQLAEVIGEPVRVAAPARPRARVVVEKRPFAALGAGHPRVAFASPLLMPRLHLPRVLEPRFRAIGGLLSRARPGEPVAVRLSAYCLQGTTRRGNAVRTGIIAADPRVFPLARHVELYAGGRYLGRYLVDDTGQRIKGARIDIWTPDCDDARRFGMRDGVASLVALGR